VGDRRLGVPLDLQPGELAHLEDALQGPWAEVLELVRLSYPHPGRVADGDLAVSLGRKEQSPPSRMTVIADPYWSFAVSRRL
jgi:hypothetical protein